MVRSEFLGQKITPLFTTKKFRLPPRKHLLQHIFTAAFISKLRIKPTTQTWTFSLGPLAAMITATNPHY
jgi:hypothetical protein